MATRKSGRKSAAARKAKRRSDIEEAVRRVQEQKIKESYAPPAPKPKKHKSRKDKRIKAESSKVKVEKVRIKAEKPKQVEKKISRKKKKAEKKRQEQQPVVSAEPIQSTEPIQQPEPVSEPSSTITPSDRTLEQWFMDEETAGYNIIQNFESRLKYYPMTFTVIVGEFLEKAAELYGSFEVALALISVENQIDDIFTMVQDYKEAALELCALVIDKIKGITEDMKRRLNDILAEYS